MVYLSGIPHCPVALHSKHLVVGTLSAVGHLCCAAVGGDSAVHMVNVCAILVILYTEVAGLWHSWALTLIPSLMKSCGICIEETTAGHKHHVVETSGYRICHLQTGSISTNEVHHQYHHKTSASTLYSAPPDQARLLGNGVEERGPMHSTTNPIKERERA